MKVRIFLFTIMMSVFGIFTTSQTMAKEMTREQTEMRIAQIKERVHEIKSTDLSHLNLVERIGLKHELQDMKHELSTMEPYVYISAGALLLIIVLVLVLL